MIGIYKIAPKLECHQNGIWFSRNRSQVSYPEDGNLHCFDLEAESFWFRHRNKSIVALMNQFPPADTLFDVGAGNGCVSLALKNAGQAVAVVEPGLQGALNAHKRGLSPVICSTIEDAGFNPRSVPAVGIFDVLEHIENEIDFLVTLKRVLIQNGRLYITVPAYNLLWSVDDIHAGHFRRYTIDSLASMLESVGFNIEFKTYIFSVLPLPIYFFRTIPYKLGLRTESQSDRKIKEHIRYQLLFNRILSLLFSYELQRLKNKKEIPFGGSCLVVAKSL